MNVTKALDMEDAPRHQRRHFTSDFRASSMDVYEYVWTRNATDQRKEFELNGKPVDVVDLCRTNGFDAATVATLRSLQAGESMRFGGQGCMTVKRVY